MCSTLFNVIVFASIFVLNVVCFPGAKVRLTKSAFDYGVNLTVAHLSKKIRGAKISDLHGSSHGLQYDLTNLRISQFSIGYKSLRPVTGKGIEWDISGVQIRLDGNFRYKYKKLFIRISDHGSFQVTARGLTMTILVKIASDAQTQRPTLSSQSCACRINQLRVKFTGGKAKWLYNLLAGLARRKIQSTVQKLICEEATKAVNVDGNKAMKKLKVMAPVADHFTLDYGFISDPQFFTQYMETYHKGEVYWTSDRQPTHFSPKPFSTLSNSTKMVYIWMSEYVANTFAYAAFKHNFLHYNLTAAELPPKSRYYLKTTCSNSMCMGTIFPEMSTYFPNCSVKISINATKTLTTTFTPEQIQIAGQGELYFYAVNSKNEEKFMLHLGMDMSSNGTAWVATGSDKIFAHVAKIRLKFAVIKSAIGDKVTAARLDQMSKIALMLYIVPKLNELGERGFNLPLSGKVGFHGAKLTFTQGAIIISSDVTYKDEVKKESNSPWMHEPKTMEVVGIDDQTYNRL